FWKWDKIWEILAGSGRARDDDVVDIVLDPGDVFVFHGWTLHASQPNRSSRRRCGFNFHYVNPNVGFKLGHKIMAGKEGVLLQGGDGGHKWPPRPTWTRGEDFEFRGAQAFV